MTLKLLLDEHISPFLTRNLAQLGVFAQAVVHVGLSGEPDHAVWAFAARHEMAVVTTNTDDFLELAHDVEVHSGLILLRESGLSREEQWIRLECAVRFILSQRDPDYLLNKVVDVLGPEHLHCVDFPKPQK